MFKYHLKNIFALVLVSTALLACNAATDSETKAVTAKQESVMPAVHKKCVVTPPDEPMACTMQYDPVCGCDGKTYGNACSARGAGVPHSTPGPCEESSNN